jgi:hypothetical protein
MTGPSQRSRYRAEPDGAPEEGQSTRYRRLAHRVWRGDGLAHISGEHPGTPSAGALGSLCQSQALLALMFVASPKAGKMKSIIQYVSAVRELIRQRVRVLSEYDRTELDFDEDSKRHQSKRRGREPTIPKRTGIARPERE